MAIADVNQDYFFAVASLSPTERDVFCFWAEIENIEYAEDMGLEIIYDSEELQEDGVKYKWAGVHGYRPIFADDGLIIISINIIPIGVCLTPVDDMDVENWLDAVEENKELESWKYMDFLDV